MGQAGAARAEELEGRARGAGGWVRGTESCWRPQPTAHSLALLSLAASLGLFWEALHTACHFPAGLPVKNKTSPATAPSRRAGAEQPR